MQIASLEDIYDPETDSNYEETFPVIWNNLFILGYPNYLVSSRGGVVWNISSNCKLESHKDKGYPMVAISDGKKTKKIAVHILVCTAFRGLPPFEDATVDHRDKTRSNNDIDNLFWATRKEQVLNRKVLEKDARDKCITQTDKNGVDIFTWFSMKDAVKAYNLKSWSINGAVRARTECAGFTWKIEMGDFHGEIWKQYPLDGRDDLYFSNRGRYRKLKSSNTGYGATNSSGYKDIRIKAQNKTVRLLLHVAIAKLFIGPPPATNIMVNHKDGNRCNNKLENLEYATPSENSKHMYDTGLRDNKTIRCNGKTKRKPVNQYDMNGILLRQHESIEAAARHVDSGPNGISLTCRGKYSHSAGYKWKFAEE